MSGLSDLLVRVSVTGGGGVPVVGRSETEVHMDLAPFVISTSFGKPMFHDGWRVEGDKGKVRFAFFEPSDVGFDPVSVLLDETSCCSWPNVMRRTVDVDSLCEASLYLEEFGLRAHSILTNVGLDLGTVEDLRVIDGPIEDGTAIVTAPPEYVGRYVTCGSSAGFVIHNFWRGMVFIDGRDADRADV